MNPCTKQDGSFQGAMMFSGMFQGNCHAIEKLKKKTTGQPHKK
jgi:hypothetical protein